MSVKVLAVLFCVIVQSHARGYGLNNYIADKGLDNSNLKTTSNFNNIQRIANNGIIKPIQTEKVKIQVYYECHCPDCREFDSKQLKETVRLLGPYLDINMYPYGNAKTKERNGQYEFICQHGPEECYGNKLHACAIDLLKNATLSVFYNACMMDESQAGRGSDDRAADVCGQSMGINSAAIKECAKGNRGTLLLKHYGDESKKANFNYVPYILINGILNDGDHFLKDVCKAFTNPPPTCRTLIDSYF